MNTQTLKADRLTRIMLVPLMAFLFLCLLLCAITTPLCAAMLLPGALVFLSSYGIFLLAARKRVGRFVRMYVTNRFFLNADSSSAKAMQLSLLLGAACALVLFLFSEPFSHAASGSVRALGAFRLSLLFFLLHALQGALSGFVEGAGKRGLVLKLDVLRCVLMLGGVPVAGYAGFLFGTNIDTLLVTDDCCAAYCALFSIAALLAIDMVFLVLFLVVRSVTLKQMRKSKKTKPRYIGDEPAFFKSCGQLMATAALPCVLLAVSLMFYDKTSYTVSVFAPRFFLIPALIALFVSLRFIGACYRLPGLSDEIETGGMSLRFRRLLHRLSIVLPVMTALYAVLASPMNTLLYAKEGEDGLTMLMGGAVYSAVFCAFVVFCILLSLVKRRKQMALLTAASLLVCMVLSLLIVRFTSFGLAGLLAVHVLSLMVFTAGAYLVLTNLLQEHGGAFPRMLVKPAMVAVASALLVYPLQAELVHLIGEATTCVLCGAAGFAAYLVLMAVFKGFEWGDLMSLPFGRELVRLSLRKRK